MEEEVRKQLQEDSAKTLSTDTKKTLLDAVLRNDDLQFIWSSLSSTIDEHIGEIVLRKIVELYITVRLGKDLLLLHHALQPKTQEKDTKV